MAQSLQQAALKRARDIAGGVTFLGRAIQIPADALDAMIHGRAAIPTWLFLRVVDYVNEAEAKGMAPPRSVDDPDVSRP